MSIYEDEDPSGILVMNRDQFRDYRRETTDTYTTIKGPLSTRYGNGTSETKHEALLGAIEHLKGKARDEGADIVVIKDWVRIHPWHRVFTRGEFSYTLVGETYRRSEGPELTGIRVTEDGIALE